jgi:hypothetical protein
MTQSIEQRFPRPSVMGVVNITPDSFSDGGVNFDPGDAVAAASSGSKLTPPSENESGVTLTTPMMEGRGKRWSMGGFIRG